ncbi:hypothetical protein AB0I53_41540 [Saccharopolyspora sp. NPDC050389]|uniref:hypothetical protein n=1 Tax=Saccharopolyspora sp. NPDC050389 TaxID=3155516 RepID=UPI0033DA6FA2
MRRSISKRATMTISAGLTIAVAATVAATVSAQADNATDTASDAKVEVFAPRNGDNAGTSGRGWFVDLAVDFRGQNGPARAGLSGLQLTGPAGHNNVPPFPGTFSPGKDDRLPGLVVLTSSTITNPERKFAGPGTNLANLFNLTGLTDRADDRTEVWDTWIVGDAIAGKGVDTTLTVAVVDDLDHNGVFDDAPDVVADFNHDGRIDAKDLEILGVASNIEQVRFHINANPL